MEKKREKERAHREIEEDLHFKTTMGETLSHVVGEFAFQVLIARQIMNECG